MNAEAEHYTNVQNSYETGRYDLQTIFWQFLMQNHSSSH